MNRNKDKKTWNLRLLDFILNGFLFGLAVSALDLSGVDLNWEIGVRFMILALIVAVISVVIGEYSFSPPAIGGSQMAEQKTIGQITASIPPHIKQAVRDLHWMARRYADGRCRKSLHWRLAAI